MSWEQVIDQERVCRVLRRALEQERVPHAYLFHGPEGVGKRAAGLALARALLCQTNHEVPCESCTACRKTRRMVHPDLHVLFPYPKGTGEDDIAQRIERLGAHPYAAVGYARRPSLDDPAATSNKQVMYHIDRVHTDLLRPMSFRPVEGLYKVALITDVEYMNESAANAFLKLLEEPPPQTVFVLTTSRPEQLLPTIVSRCQRLRFDALTPEAIEQALAEREEMAPSEAATLARMADGSYMRALALHQNRDLMASRTLVLDYLRAAYTGNVEQLNTRINEMGSQGREQVKSLLHLMLRWLRDLLLYQTLGDEAPLVNVDQAPAIARFCENLPQADLAAMTELVEQAIELTGRNVRLNLILTVLAQVLGRAMRGYSVSALYVPLSEAGISSGR